MLTRRRYNALLALLAPLFWLAGWRRCRRARRLGLHLPACLSGRFGHIPSDWRSGGIWLHAVSVGESRSIFPLLEALHRHHPDLPLTVTNGSIQGALQVQRFAPVPVQNGLIPYDYPHAVARFLDRLRPRLVVIVETELWPNLFAACARRNIPLVMINARLKTRSFERYRRWGQPLVGETLHHARLVGTQFEVDAERFRTLGAQRVEVLGNLKFDLRLPDNLHERARQLRLRLGGRFIWVAGSTHAGEEEQMLAAHARLRAAYPDALLILAPRHADRFDEVARLLQRTGVTHVHRSRGDIPGADTAVWLADTVGELLLWYALADAAFVGGSLVPFGGHNILEPAAVGTPVLSGPHYQNLQALFDSMLACDGVHIVQNEETLAEQLRLWADQPRLARQQGERAQACFQRHQGALDRTLERIKAVLGGQ